MKKILVILLILFTGINTVTASDFIIEDIELRPQKTFFLPKGTFIKLQNIKEITSLTLDEGDEITMLNASDIYVAETKIIPEKTIFYGYVEKIHEPVQGTNAGIIIKMEKMITPEGHEYQINGYLSGNGSNKIIGGDIAPPLYYAKMPHYTKWKLTRWKVGAGQYCETNTRQFGTHTVIKAGAELFLILQENFNLVQL